MGPSEHVVVIGAGVGGLSAALALAGQGVPVTVLERASAPGGKMRAVAAGGALIDGGPTVFTMRWVFEDLFDEAGLSLSAELPLARAERLARHAWGETGRLDLFADLDRSADAVAAFAGPREAKGFRAFSAHAREMFETLKGPFLEAARPNPITLSTRVGLNRLDRLLRLKPFSTLWGALGTYFQDQRLRQLFGRYATYCGSSPFAAPATLMLVAHVEQAGVWYVDGGMRQLAATLARMIERKGGVLRYGADVSRIHTGAAGVEAVELASGERLACTRIIVNADASALGAGLFGSEVAGAVAAVRPVARSLSALVWTAMAETKGFPLIRHNVFFSRDYRGEFTRIFGEGRLPDEPTVYVCAQDRGDDGADRAGPERLLILVNAPANGDHAPLPASEIDQCWDRTVRCLARSGLSIASRPGASVLTGPAEFENLFPATGGALYGRASHGWMASFQRPDGRTRIPGLYLAGGSVHPGPGVPMAALSGRLAARALLSDLVSTAPYRRAAISGGISTA